MPNLKTYDLFISHAWKYGDDYDRLVALLDSALYFSYRNCSAPKDRPIAAPWERLSKAVLRAHLERKIRPVNAVLVISGMYYSYHEWMQMELDTARDYDKPVIAIRPRGNAFIPAEVNKAACSVVNWNTYSIVEAIRNHAI